MTVLPIRVVGDPVLHAPTVPLPGGDRPELTDATRQLIADMVDTLRESRGVGLSANQIGSSARIFVYDCPEGVERTERRRGVVVNPVMVGSEAPTEPPDEDRDQEGCLSVPGFMFPIARSDWARVRGFDGDGRPVVVEGRSVFARMLQHEMAHLDGILYVDQLVEPYATVANQALKALATSGWAKPWTPGVDPHPFAPS